jgi:hypothetical protein
VFFLGYFFGTIFTAITGAAAWLQGRRSGRQGDVGAGKIALGWVVLGILCFLLLSNLNS